MKNALVTLLFSTSSLFAQADYSTLLLLSPPAAAGATYLIEEGFEEVDGGGALGGATDGYDSALVAAETGTPNNDYATSPAPLTGSYSLFLDPSATSQQVRWILSAAVTNSGLFVDYFDANLPSDANQPIIEISDSGGTQVASVYSRTSGALQIFHNGTSGTTTEFLSATLTNRIWVDFNTNGARVAFSYDTTKPASGNKVAVATNATPPNAAIRFQLRSVNGTGNASIFDNLKVSESVIGSNP